MAITLTDDLLRDTQIKEEELRVDLACFLYDKKRLSFGKAARFAGVNQLQFQKELAARDIYIKYDLDDFDRDLQTIGLAK